MMLLLALLATGTGTRWSIAVSITGTTHVQMEQVLETDCNITHSRLAAVVSQLVANARQVLVDPLQEEALMENEEEEEEGTLVEDEEEESPLEDPEDEAPTAALSSVVAAPTVAAPTVVPPPPTRLARLLARSAPQPHQPLTLPPSWLREESVTRLRPVPKAQMFRTEGRPY
jgi:hypothetical protein